MAPPRPGSAAQVLLALGALLLALGAVELGFRLVRPTPRAQPIEGSRRVELRDSEGVPLWRTLDDPRTRADAPCLAEHPGAAQVVGLGSSILYGVKVEPERTWAPLLAARLGQAGIEACVHNLSGPGFGALQKRQLLREQAAPLRPDLVIWELWGTDPLQYRMLGDVAWRLGDLELGPDGYPNPMGLPLPVNRVLFDRSAAWRHLTLELTPPGAPPATSWREVLHGPVDEAVALAEATGGRVLLLAMPPLDRPFAELAAERDPMVDAVEAWLAGQQGRPVRVLRLAELLAGDEVTALRLDTCCHYNEDGHARLAEVLAPEVATELGR